MKVFSLREEGFSVCTRVGRGKEEEKEERSKEKDFVIAPDDLSQTTILGIP